jgi:hypothetical protein
VQMPVLVVALARPEPGGATRPRHRQPVGIRGGPPRGLDPGATAELAAACLAPAGGLCAAFVDRDNLVGPRAGRDARARRGPRRGAAGWRPRSTSTPSQSHPRSRLLSRLAVNAADRRVLEITRWSAPTFRLRPCAHSRNGAPR